MNPRSSRFLGVARFLSLLSLAVWIGGLAMIGLSAPAIFKVNRLLGPRAVAAMLERFSPVTMVCSVVLLGCWLWEWRQSSTRNRSLRVQGLCTLVMLLLGGYLALVAEPRIRALQPPLQQTVLMSETVQSANGTTSINPTQVTVKARQFASSQARQEFRKLHGVYGGVTSVVVLLGVVILALLAWRSSAAFEYSKAAREDAELKQSALL